MLNKRIIILASMSLSYAVSNADSLQTIHVLNDSAQKLNISAENIERSLNLKQVVPAFAKSFVVIQITQLESLQDMLFEGILNNSPAEILQAIQAGANINLEKEGKRPLQWAIAFHRVDAVRCLLERGAF